MRLSEIDSFEGIYGYFVENNIVSQHALPEFNAVSYGDKISSKSGFPRLKGPVFDKSDEILFITKGGIVFEILMRARYEKTNSYSNPQLKIKTFPEVGASLKRKSKKCPEGIRLEKTDLNNAKDYKKFLYNAGLDLLRAKQRQLASWLLELRATDLIDKDELVARELASEYDAIESDEDRNLFLSEHGFEGLENFDYEGTSGPDGYGHSKGTSKEIDFRNKRINIISWSSDD